VLPWIRNNWFICIVVDIIFANVVNSIKIFRSSCQLPDICVGVLTKFESFRQAFAKLSNVQCDTNSSSGSRDVKADRQTDRHDQGRGERVRAVKKFLGPQQKRIG
jgi:hypothetical protein